jgi:NAD dependent epimerase/dehydratase
MNNKRVLVTGAAGFIGSHLTQALLDAGATVTAMTHYNSANSIGNLAHLPPHHRAALRIAPGNIEDSDFVVRSMENQDIVLHLAALIAIPYSYAAPRSYVRTNIEGTLNVLEAARRLGTPRIVHTSTSEVYGTARRTPIDEDHPLQGQSPYSASKIGADMLAESYYRSFELPVVTLRPFNTYGPRQSARAFIPTIIAQALARPEIHLGSLTPRRDMTYVADTVAGFLAAATVPNIEGHTINLGTGQAHSIGDFATRILALMNCTKPIIHDPARDRPANSEVLELRSNNTRAQTLLNWTPQTPLDTGLLAAITFITHHQHLYTPNTYVV